MTKPTVLHVSFDFPTPLAVPTMTRAVERLVDGATDFRNVVYGVTRVGWRRGIAALAYAPDRVAIAYGGAPKGLTLRRDMHQIADWILQDLERRGLRIDLIHAHKISTDGLVAHRLARDLRVPFVCSLWGNADGHVIGGRPDLRPLWRDIAGRAAALLPAAPWTARTFSELLKVDPGKMTVLPVLSKVPAPRPSTARGGPLVALFHLDHHRNKNVGGLLRALADGSGRAGGPRLDIYGGGSARSFHDLAAAVRRLGLGDRVSLKGPVANTAVPDILNASAGLVMPSLRESFGMVYVEALFSGVPVLYSAGWGIDGFFPVEQIGYACDPRDPQDIASGIGRIVAEETRLKSTIARLQVDGDLDFLAPDRIIETYQTTLRLALEARA